jgi:AcrR family transcriptional regulator
LVVSNAILNAAFLLLQERDYRTVTIEGIAAKAGVGKQTIYRWWPSKAAVVLEAFTARAESDVPVPDTGNLKADLERFLGTTFEKLSHESGPIVRALMSEALLDREFGDALREIFIAKRRQALHEIFYHAVQRGDVCENIDFEVVIDLIYGPMWYRLLNAHAPLNTQFARQLTAFIMKSLQKSNDPL